MLNDAEQHGRRSRRRCANQSPPRSLDARDCRHVQAAHAPRAHGDESTRHRARARQVIVRASRYDESDVDRWWRSRIDAALHAVRVAASARLLDRGCGLIGGVAAGIANLAGRRARWRKRLGVEPSLPRKEAATDFEDREGHRAPFTSAAIIQSTAGDPEQHSSLRCQTNPASTSSAPASRNCSTVKPPVATAIEFAPATLRTFDVVRRVADDDHALDRLAGNVVGLRAPRAIGTSALRSAESSLNAPHSKKSHSSKCCSLISAASR